MSDLPDLQPTPPVSVSTSQATMGNIYVGRCSVKNPSWIYLAVRSFPAHFIEWSPTGEELMLNAPNEGETLGTEIYLLSTDGFRSRLLVEASGGYLMNTGIHADLSPDGAALVYSTCDRASFSLGEYEIATLGIVEGDSRLLTLADGVEVEYLPAWSPDGSRIAFLSVPKPHSFYAYDDTVYLHTMKADGSERQNLSPHIEESGSVQPFIPTWSPDGERLAYVQSGHYPNQLYTVQSDGSGLQGVTAVTTGAAWAPEGWRFAFGKLLPRSSPDDSYSTLCVAELDDVGYPRLSQLTATDAFDGPVVVRHVSWSPDGDLILFLVDEYPPGHLDERGRFINYASVPTASSVYVVRPDGTGLRRLLEEERPYTAAAWSPDGSRIAVRVDPQIGMAYVSDPQSRQFGLATLGQTSTVFEVLIVDRDGDVQKVLGREEVLGTN